MIDDWQLRLRVGYPYTGSSINTSFHVFH